MVAALVLASCAPAAVEEEKEPEVVVGEVEEAEAPVLTPEEEEEEEEEAASAMEKVTFYKLDGTPVAVEVEPAKYGGWLTTSFDSEDITAIFDPVYATRQGWTSTITYERIAQGDWTKGPRGTNEFPFTAPPAPDWVLGPQLAESWELPDAKTMIVHLRPGVRFHNIPPVSGREAVAEDWKKEWEREMANDRASFYYPPEKRPTITVIGKYTFKVEYPENDVMMLNVASIRYPVVPWEIIDEEGLCNDPDLQIGTGAFMLQDVVTGISLTWVKNPNYWKYDPFHPQNKLPYMDGITIMIIPDFGTRKAAFRTGKVDVIRGLDIDSAEELWETALWANWRLNERVGAIQLWMNTQIEPWTDVRVRRAMSMAFDHDYYNEVMWKGLGVIVAWPVGPWAGSGVFTPLEELPDDIRVLFEYHPEEAKALLEEAEYPNGFETTFITTPTGTYFDTALLAQEMFAKVGVDITIETTESLDDYLYGHGFPGFTICFWEPAFAADVLYYCYDGKPSIRNFSNVNDPLSREAYATFSTIVDPDERDAFLKEENLRHMYQCYSIPMPSAGVYYFWQPWVKNYGGEAGTCTEDAWGWHTGFYNFWIDQELKKKMGF